MRTSSLSLFSLVCLLPVAGLGAPAESAASQTASAPHPFGAPEVWQWKPNDRSRPLPPVVEPAPEAGLATAAQAPADATVLFDGKDLSQWQPSAWKVENGYVEITPKSHNLATKADYGSFRLHLEWWTPPAPPLGPPLKTDQKRGNSWVFCMGLYEVQVLDTYQNKTYADGMAGAIYGQYPPKVNPIRPPGQWQYYDIEFHHPVFDAAGKILRPARATVDFNGIRVQDNVELTGPTGPGNRRPYVAHANALPLQLQYHNEVVRYRNIWIVPIAD